MTAEWTLDELVAQVAAALDAGTYAGAPNGRVRELPDRRAIRWYTTRGLLDRPLRHNGRVACYGERHLLQLVAIKRRQAAGRTLAEIQSELLSASDDTLRRIAALPDPPHPREPVPAPQVRPAPRAAFWRDRPATPSVPAAVAEPDEPAPGLFTGVPLGGGVVLLLPTTPGTDDLAALRAAARPLLDLLTARGLAGPPTRSAS